MKTGRKDSKAGYDRKGGGTVEPFDWSRKGRACRKPACQLFHGFIHQKPNGDRVVLWPTRGPPALGENRRLWFMLKYVNH